MGWISVEEKERLLPQTQRVLTSNRMSFIPI